MKLFFFFSLGVRNCIPLISNSLQIYCINIPNTLISYFFYKRGRGLEYTTEVLNMTLSRGGLGLGRSVIGFVGQVQSGLSD